MVMDLELGLINFFSLKILNFTFAKKEKIN